jgi:hypothetical protein
MKMNKILLALFAVSILFTSCKKKFETPPRESEPAVSSYITIDSIYQRFKTYYVTPTVTPTKLYRFSGDVTLEAIVTADEASGNIYKSVYVQDSTGGLKINLVNSGGLYVGDKIHINLNNVVLNDYGDVVQLDSIDITKRVYKISSGNIVTPKKITFAEINALMGFGGIYKYQSQLVLIDSVEFSAGDKMETYADAVNKVTKEITLVNKNGGTGTAIVRNSGYSNFASSLVPCGSGSVVVIMGQFGSTSQLTIRSVNDVKLSSGGCPLIVKSFNDNSATSKGWVNYNVTGNVHWTVETYNGRTYGYISNYIASANQACETWLISPPINLTSAPSPYLIFQSAYNYTGPTLEVLISTDYNSGNPNLATWVDLAPPLSSGSWNWTSSGNVSLAGYSVANVRIAYKYSGTSSNGSTWEIDDIAVFAQ